MQHSVIKEINSLSFLKVLGSKFNLYVIGEFEIEPFTKWSTEFASEYWFLKYNLLKNGEVKLKFSEDDFEFLCLENNLNIIWLTVTDHRNFILKCVDGNWRVEILDSEFDGLEELLNI